MDIEADPAGYQALRHARDAALRHAEGVEGETVLLEDPTAVLGGDLEANAVVSSPPTNESAEFDEWFEQLREDTNAVAAVLEGACEEQRQLFDDEAEEVVVRFNRISANPLAARVDILAQGSDVFADLIARTIPQSDLLIGPASALFGWSHVDELAEDPALAYVMQRSRDLEFARELDDPNHRLHKAWVELCKPADEHSRRNWFIRTAKIQELLRKVRGGHQTLEWHFDSWRVGQWEHRGTGGKRTLFFAFWIALIVLRLWLGSIEADNRTPAEVSATPVVLEEKPASLEEEWREVTFAWAGSDIGGQLREANPKLFELFSIRWSQALANDDERRAFRERMVEFMRTQIGAAWFHAPPELLRRRAELERETLLALSGRPEECKYFVQGEPFVAEHSYRSRLRRLDAELAMVIHPRRKMGERMTGRRTFKVPGDVVQQAQSTSGLSEPEMQQALQLTGPALRLCQGRTALMTALLDASATTSTPVFRQMFGG